MSDAVPAGGAEAGGAPLPEDASPEVAPVRPGERLDWKALGA